MVRICRLSQTKCIYIFRIWMAVAILCIMQFCNLALVSPSTIRVKELNFVFLHGMGSSSASTQLLADIIGERALTYISTFEQANQGTTVKINILQRSYPNNIDVDTWARNVGDAVEKYFPDKRDLILVGHSMGGKVALYAAANNILNDKVAMVVTINSPVKSLNSYYCVGGISVSDYIRSNSLIISDKGVADSIGSYDSSSDGLKVSNDKHWLAFISAESAPLSEQFEFKGVDPFPKDMDDGLVPISAQYAQGADVVYYGEYGHSAFATDSDVAASIADKIMMYLFGEGVETSVFGYEDSFEHHAGWFPFTYSWDDRFGESSGSNGIVSHTNSSFFKWQEWEDVVGECSPGNSRGSYQIDIKSFPFLTCVVDVRWINPFDETDCRLYIKSRAAPRTRVQVDWDIITYQPLSSGYERDHYEIKMLESTTLTRISQALWLTNDMSDSRLQIQSQADGPFRWFEARIDVYYRQSIQRKVIDEITYQD